MCLRPPGGLWWPGHPGLHSGKFLWRQKAATGLIRRQRHVSTLLLRQLCAEERLWSFLLNRYFNTNQKLNYWLETWHSGHCFLWAALFSWLHSLLAFFPLLTSSSFLTPSNFVVANSQNVEEAWTPRSGLKSSTLMPSLGTATIQVAQTVCGWSRLKRATVWRSFSTSLRSRRRLTAATTTWSYMTGLTSSLQGWDGTAGLG